MKNSENYGFNIPEETDFIDGKKTIAENFEKLDEILAEEHMQEVSNGGTGATTAKGAEYNINGDMAENSSVPTDEYQIAFKYSEPNSTKGVFYFAKAVLIWEYIKTKISSVLGLTETSYNGNSATATKATQDGAGNVITDTYATTANPVFTGIVSLGRKNGTTAGTNSVALGYNITANGVYSHAEGYATTASNRGSHAEGSGTTASGMHGSHAEGSDTTASGMSSHAEGVHTTALTNQHAQGHYNDTSLATANSTNGTSTGTAFVIGNGTATTASNAFRVTGDGGVYAKAAYNSTGADYAEFAEWADGNPNNEDRRGYFVTFDEEKPEMIRKANAGDYILGIISGNPCVIGNADEGWLGKYVFDDFGTIVYEDIEETLEYTDEETGETKTKTEIVTTYKLNPEFDKTQKYIHRKDRQEWDYVGWIGVLSVRDDGTCIAGGYCTVADGGIATAAERGNDTYRVIKRINNHVVKVAVK